MPEPYDILLFDGVCNLCNSWVGFVLKNNSAKNIKFAALQSESGQRILIEHGIKPSFTASLVYISADKVYVFSDAALQVAKQLQKPAYFLSYFGIFPRFIRDWAYKQLANNRYTLFGKRDNCIVPEAEVMSRFL